MAAARWRLCRTQGRGWSWGGRHHGELRHSGGMVVQQSSTKLFPQGLQTVGEG